MESIKKLNSLLWKEEENFVRTF